MATTTNGHYYPSEADFGDDAADILNQMKLMQESNDEIVAGKADSAVQKENNCNYNNPLTNVPGYINTSGNISNGNYITTDFIHLNDGDKITIDSLVRVVAKYNENKVFNSLIKNANTYGYEYTATEECYIRVSFANYLNYCNIYINNNTNDISYLPLDVEGKIKLSDLNRGEIDKILMEHLGKEKTNIPLNFTSNACYNYQTNAIAEASGYKYASFQVKAGEIYELSGYSYHSISLFVFVDTNNNRLPFPFNGYANDVTQYTDIELIVPTNGILYINKIGNRSVLCNKISAKQPVDVTSSNILHNKKYVACGDSFTNGDYTNSTSNDYLFADGIYIGLNKVYPRFIALRNKMNLVMDAINGSTMTYIQGRNNCFSEAGGRYTQIPEDADYITLKFGINDDAYHQNAPLGTIDDATNETYYGAWNIVLDYLIRNHPNAKIGIIITNGASLAIVNATIAIAKKWGVAYLNEALGEDVPLMLRSNRQDVTSSIKEFRNSYWAVNSSTETPNSHPNELAHEYESTIVENWMRGL